MARNPHTVTIRHVAAEAGVSLQTVSRVINDEPNVRAEMQERVRAAVKRLGYVPSLAARRLSGSRSYLLLALNDRDRTIEAWKLGEGSDWIDQMLYGGMLKCAEHDYRMLFELIDTHSAHVERQILGALAALRPDGVVLTPPHSDNPAITELLVERHVPFARIGSAAEGPGLAIHMDDAAAARAATEHLIELGHRRIGFITGDPEYRLSLDRERGYRTAIAAAGLSAGNQRVEVGDFGYDSGLRAAAGLLEGPQPVSALIASSDQMAFAALHVARERGIAVPDQLSVISFDDSPATRYSAPPLTAIHQPIAEMAARACELLIEVAAGRPVDLPVAPLPFRLVPRGSTGPCRE